LSLSKKAGLLSLLLLFLLPIPAFAQVANIDENNLNVRSGPGTDYDQVTQVHKGETYPILEEEGEWVKIELDDLTGWIITDYITVEGDESEEGIEEERQETTLESVTIQVDGTHMRDGASTEFDIVAFLEEGQEFDVLSETDNWLELSDGETIGFVWKDHLKPRSKTDYSLSDKTIVIDAGHGGRDVGAIGENGSFEKDITYLTASELKRELTTLGANVVVTRQGDEFVPLESRSTLANAVETDAFLSIHYNSFPEVPSVTGIETFYYHEHSQPLAQSLHEGIIRETDEPDRSVSKEDFFVTRQTFKPGVLLELGFLSNEENNALLHTTGYQKKLVTGIVHGLQEYFLQNK